MAEIWKEKAREAKLNTDAEDNTARKSLLRAPPPPFTFLLPHAEEEDDGTEDVDQADDTRGDHISCFLEGKKKNKF